MLIEVIIATAILVAGILATLGITDAARGTAATAQRTSVAGAIAQRELEAMHSQPYSALYDCTLPSASASLNDARHWISTTHGFLVQRDFRDAAGSLLSDVPAAGEAFFTGTCGVGTGGFDPGPTPFTAGAVHGEIYRFVTAEGIPCASTLTATLNAGLSGATGIDVSAGTTGLAATLLTNLTATADANIAAFFQPGATEGKRLTVGVAINSEQGGPGPHLPVYLSSIVTDPSSGQVSF